MAETRSIEQPTVAAPPPTVKRTPPAQSKSSAEKTVQVAKNDNSNDVRTGNQVAQEADDDFLAAQEAMEKSKEADNSKAQDAYERTYNKFKAKGYSEGQAKALAKRAFDNQKNIENEALKNKQE